MKRTIYFEVKDFQMQQPKYNFRKMQDVILRKSEDILLELPIHARLDYEYLKYHLKEHVVPKTQIPHHLSKARTLLHSLNKPGVNAFDVIQVLDKIDFLFDSINDEVNPKSIPDVKLVRNQGLEYLLRYEHPDTNSWDSNTLRNPCSITPVSF